MIGCIVAGALAALALATSAHAAAPAATTGYVEVNHVSLRYAVEGDGPPIILLHEMGMTMEGWDDIVPAPTLILAASLYPQRPVASVRVIADHIANARFLPLPTGHFMAIQSPELLLPVLQDFIGGLPSAR
jgi:3-oxoadipate enol-lactonase